MPCSCVTVMPSSRSLADIDRAIQMVEHSIGLTPYTSPNHAGLMRQLTELQLERVVMFNSLTRTRVNASGDAPRVTVSTEPRVRSVLYPWGGSFSQAVADMSGTLRFEREPEPPTPDPNEILL